MSARGVVPVLSGWLSSFTVWCARHTAFAASHTRARRFLRVLWSLSLLAAGALMCQRLVRLEQWRGAWEMISRRGAPLLIVLLLPAGSLLIKSLGWRALLPSELRPGVARCYSTFVAAQGVNELGFSVLGEPLKLLVVPREARSVAAAAVVEDNALALVALLAAGTTFGFCRQSTTLLAVALAGVVLFLSSQLIPRFPRRLTGFSAHFIGKLWLSLELAIGLYLLGEPVLTSVAPLSLAWSTAAALGTPVPGQLGVVEAALLHGGAAVGVSATGALALAALRRVRALLWMVLGLLLAARLLSRKNHEVRHASPSIAERLRSRARRRAAPEPLSPA